MTIHYSDDAVTLHHGDCLDVLRTLPDCSVDSVVTDPPYSLSFMGRSWDAHENPQAFQRWCTEWASECLRVLKPGGHMVAFGGPRTWHRLAAAVEDAGFEIRDSIAWLYGSGFPKSMNVAKAITGTQLGHGGNSGAIRRATMGDDYEPSGVRGNRDGVTRRSDTGMADRDLALTPEAQQWQGWGTALKPAFEPIVVGRKPLAGTVAANVLAHGTGALNIDACRVGDEVRVNPAAGNKPGGASLHMSERGMPAGADSTLASGRWPTNVLLDDTQAAELDRQSGTSTSRVGKPRGAAAGDGWGMTSTGAEYADTGGASRFFPTFRYEAKAPTSERPRSADGTAHPTVKPLDLMRWLVRLVTPPGGVVLEPFAGSGTTAEACVVEGFRCIAIEREADYLPLIVGRLSKPIQVGLDFGAVS
jgi:site-specific DNA-methyltransferase (adenine-specific)